MAQFDAKSWIVKQSNTFLFLLIVASAVGAQSLFIEASYAEDDKLKDKLRYFRLQEIYSQVKDARKNDPEKLADLEKKYVAEIEKMAKLLEKEGAGPFKPAKQKLFFTAKYCIIPILKKKHLTPSTIDKYFLKYQKKTAKLLGIKSVKPKFPAE